MQKLKLAVLISGSGSNLQAIIDACKGSDYPAEISCVISSNENAYGLERAKAAGISHIVMMPKSYEDRIHFDQAMHEMITSYGAELVCMAGFMRLITPWFIEKWHNRLINIHPSLLPSFKGLHAQEQALEAGVRIAGCTVHYVREAMDSGPIIMQAAVPVLPSDTVESLTARILTEEHRIYPQVIRNIAEKQVTIEGDHLTFKE